MEAANAFFVAIIPLATVGVVQFYNQLKLHDWDGAVTILIAALVGLVAGLTGYLGLSVADGVTLALSAVGVHTTARQIG